MARGGEEAREDTGSKGVSGEDAGVDWVEEGGVEVGMVLGGVLRVCRRAVKFRGLYGSEF